MSKKSDSESHGQLNGLKLTNDEDNEKIHKLKSLERYQKMTVGQEAVVFKSAMDRKIRATSLLSNKGKSHPPHCTFLEMGIKCTGKIIPKSKFCRKHILKDPKQILFRACGILHNDKNCQDPIINFDTKSTCILHEKLPMLL